MQPDGPPKRRGRKPKETAPMQEDLDTVVDAVINNIVMENAAIDRRWGITRIVNLEGQGAEWNTVIAQLAFQVFLPVVQQRWPNQDENAHFTMAMELARNRAMEDFIRLNPQYWPTPEKG